jgi:DNA primase large subunit
MRIYISRYYVNIGYPPEKVAELFAKQSDYNYEYSLKQVKGLASVVCGHIRYETLRDKCSDFVARFEKKRGYYCNRTLGECKLLLQHRVLISLCL